MSKYARGRAATPRPFKLLVALCWTYALGLLLCFGAGRILGDRWWWLALGNAFALYLFLPLPLVMLLAAVSRRRLAWFAVGVAGLLFLWLYGGLFIPRLPHAQAAGTTLTVLTYNLPFPYAGGSEQALVDNLLAQEADVALLQEITEPAAEMLLQRLGARYPYHVRWTGERGRGHLILSRYPLGETAVIGSVRPERSTQIATLLMEGREIVLVSVHPTSTARLARLRNLPRFVSKTFARRKQEIEEVLAALADETRPVIFAGDLNSTDQTEVYREVAARYRDGWREAGFGFGHTYPAFAIRWHDLAIPARTLRIDYVFHSDEFRAESAWTVDSGASDHLGVVVRLVLQGN